MKKLILLLSLLVFLATSCKVYKDNNIHVDHSKEKDQFKVSQKKYKSPKKCKTWK
ncbi:MAG: hypothetical protein K9G76_09830 [Bacteroidales bacterium]|nr:hypothetical protein [Bacteroidales bacterium]MCF8403998.1 hypothetical protein [Bacteroidales bacterium]